MSRIVFLPLASSSPVSSLPIFAGFFFPAVQILRFSSNRDGCVPSQWSSSFSSYVLGTCFMLLLFRADSLSQPLALRCWLFCVLLFRRNANASLHIPNASLSPSSSPSLLLFLKVEETNPSEKRPRAIGQLSFFPQFYLFLFSRLFLFLLRHFSSLPIFNVFNVYPNVFSFVLASSSSVGVCSSLLSSIRALPLL